MNGGRLALAACLLVALGAAACGQKGGPTHPQSPTGKAATQAACKDGAKSPITDRLLDNLALLATNAPRDKKKFPSVQTDAELDRYVHDLLDDPRFAEVVAPNTLMPKILFRGGASDIASVLSVDSSGPEPVYYLRGRCNPSKAVSVHPWWALDTVVKVCPDAYQPDHLRVPGIDRAYCGAAVGNPYCGCGPNLALCARDGAQKDAIIESMKKEVALLVARVVKKDAPVREVYLANETERDRNVEYVYRRWRISSGEPAMPLLADLSKWPETPVLAPRYEAPAHMHAGVLTTPAALGLEGSIRARMKWFYDAMWCDEPPGGTVTAAAIFDLPSGDVREGDGWQQLAGRPVCTECHARLDYGGHFFTGFSTSFTYDPKKHESGRGKLYARDISDARGEAELTPHGFAELATAQPEFSSCVVRHVKRRVLVDAMDDSDDGVLESAFKQHGTLKPLMAAAMKIYADKERSTGCSSSPEKVEPSTAELFQTHCSACHGPKRLPDFDKPLDTTTLVKALNQVAFGTMPKAPIVMTRSEREHMVDVLVRRIWTDPAAQAQARAYYEDARALPVHSLKGLLATVDTRAGVAPGATPFDHAGEQRTRGDLLRYTPGVAALVHFEALKACKAAGHQGPALATCVDAASKVDDAVRTTADR